MRILIIEDEPHWQHRIREVVSASATGYVVKDSTAPEWLSAMTELRAGNSPISPKIARHILRRVQQPSIFLPEGSLPAGWQPTLSSRETEVLRLVAKGFSLVE